jgi:hypothetical protein
MTSHDPSSFERSKTLSVTIGDPDEESGEECEDDVINLHERFKKMAFEDDSLSPAIFVDDRDVILPSTSATDMDAIESDVCATAALQSVFGNESRLFQPITPGTFIEEAIVEKPPKVVNVSYSITYLLE